MSSPGKKRAWLIGASSGMGLEVGRLLVADGWQVTLSARNPGRLAGAATELGCAHAVVDVTDAAAVEQLAAILFEAGPPELVLVNAGTSYLSRSCVSWTTSGTAT